MCVCSAKQALLDWMLFLYGRQLCKAIPAQTEWAMCACTAEAVRVGQAQLEVWSKDSLKVVQQLLEGHSTCIPDLIGSSFQLQPDL